MFRVKPSGRPRKRAGFWENGGGVRKKAAAGRRRAGGFAGVGVVLFKVSETGLWFMFLKPVLETGEAVRGGRRCFG
jgi:hypothetical protein